MLYHAHFKNNNELTCVKFENGEVTATLTKKIVNMESNETPKEVNYSKPFPIFHFLERAFEEKELEQTLPNPKEERRRKHKRRQKREHQRRQKREHQKQLKLALLQRNR